MKRNIGPNLAFLVLLAFVAAMLLSVNSLIDNAVNPVVGTKLTLDTVNGGNAEWVEMNLFQQNKETIRLGLYGLAFAVVVLVIFWNINKKTALVMLLGASALMTSGCWRQYDVPEFKEIETNQTAFVIPLEGASKEDQVQFGSAEYLEARKVATKRIQIPHRWNQTGRMDYMGEWIPTVKVVPVNRSPVTREWQSSGVVANKGNDTAIWIESADSVGFSMGWSCTAFVREEDTAQFLYMYPSGSLENVMDTEVRARIQQMAALVAAQYRMDDLRTRKNEIASAVTSDVVEFFNGRGITITTVGMFGGMTYENPDIQKSIDGTFVTQQEKVNSKAKLEAQDDINRRIKSEAAAVAEAAITKAEGEAKGRLALAQADAAGKLALSLADAEGIKALNNAIAESGQKLLELKRLENEKIRSTKWNGVYPSTVVGNSANLWVGLPSGDQMSPAAAASSAGQ